MFRQWSILWRQWRKPNSRAMKIYIYVYDNFSTRCIIRCLNETLCVYSFTCYFPVVIFSANRKNSDKNEYAGRNCELAAKEFNFRLLFYLRAYLVNSAVSHGSSNLRLQVCLARGSIIGSTIDERWLIDVDGNFANAFAMIDGHFCSNPRFYLFPAKGTRIFFLPLFFFFLSLLDCTTVSFTLVADYATRGLQALAWIIKLELSHRSRRRFTNWIGRHTCRHYENMFRKGMNICLVFVCQSRSSHARIVWRAYRYRAKYQSDKVVWGLWDARIAHTESLIVEEFLRVLLQRKRQSSECSVDESSSTRWILIDSLYIDLRLTTSLVVRCSSNSIE